MDEGHGKTKVRVEKGRCAQSGRVGDRDPRTRSQTADVDVAGEIVPARPISDLCCFAELMSGFVVGGYIAKIRVSA